MFLLMSHEKEIEILYSYNRLFIGMKEDDNIYIRSGDERSECVTSHACIISEQNSTEEDQGAIIILRRMVVSNAISLLLLKFLALISVIALRFSISIRIKYAECV